MMDNIYEEYESMEEFENKSMEGQPSLGKAVDNSIVFIMDDNLLPKKVFQLDNVVLQQILRDFFVFINV